MGLTPSASSGEEAQQVDILRVWQFRGLEEPGSRNLIPRQGEPRLYAAEPLRRDVLEVMCRQGQRRYSDDSTRGSEGIKRYCRRVMGLQGVWRALITP